MYVSEAPEPYNNTSKEIFKDMPKIFLGGTIDMGNSENWQELVIEHLKNYDNILVFNPRRGDWNPSWVQDPTPGTMFEEQVTWELETQEASDIMIYNFEPNSKSPITMLELGLFINSGKAICVICNEQFYRYGNIKVVCDRYNVKIFPTLQESFKAIEEELNIRTYKLGSVFKNEI